MASLFARMRCLAGDLGVHADVVEGADEDGDCDCGDLIAALRGAGEFMALAGGDGADDEPYDEQDRSDSHGCLQANAMLRSGGSAGGGWLLATAAAAAKRPARADAGKVQGEARQAEQQEAQRGEDGGGGCRRRVDEERDDEQAGRDVTEHVCPSQGMAAIRRLPGSGDNCWQSSRFGAFRIGAERTALLAPDLALVATVNRA